MSHRNYTAEEKLHALEHLAAHGGDVELTAASLGIPKRTLARWKQIHMVSEMPMPTVPMPMPMPTPTPPLSADVIEALGELQREMMQIAHTLSHAIEPAIAEAPLGQRVAALAQLIDRIIKLGAQLPQSSEPIEIELADSEGEEPDGEDEDLSSDSAS
jgi:transposase-like protein